MCFIYTLIGLLKHKNFSIWKHFKIVFGSWIWNFIETLLETTPHLLSLMLSAAIFNLFGNFQLIIFWHSEISQFWVNAFIVKDGFRKSCLFTFIPQERSENKRSRKLLASTFLFLDFLWIRLREGLANCTVFSDSSSLSSSLVFLSEAQRGTV